MSGRQDSEPAPSRRGARTKAEKSASVAGVVLTHPDRIYWREGPIRKRDLADYYATVWKWIEPHIVGRPMAVLRCPEGSAGPCFFQKHAKTGIAADLLHLTPEKGDEIFSVDRLEGVIALVQAGTLEIHVRGSTIDDLTRADRLVFDLDPGPDVGWDAVVAAAREVGARLERLRLRSFVKTTGGKGLHVVVPIRPAPWHAVGAFCRALAAAMEKDDPRRYVASAAKRRRAGRIFIDYLRNSHDATSIAPYSTRARPGAPVAVPVAWSELPALASANRYTVATTLRRLARLRADPWADLARTHQTLPDAA
ncbi:MAG: non-homologous end-joining DNA ligase [Pseudolabrys sp.]|nr:non-homologous end-joining DNA ligase [Pseudolabrys sp.]